MFFCIFANFVRKNMVVVTDMGAMFILGTGEVMMLDSYIIDRIKRERQDIREHEKMVPLRIHVPETVPDLPKKEREEPTERGNSEIDFQL